VSANNEPFRRANSRRLISFTSIRALLNVSEGRVPAVTATRQMPAISVKRSIADDYLDLP
jgi:predicted transcriptional regulator